MSVRRGSTGRSVPAGLAYVTDVALAVIFAFVGLLAVRLVAQRGVVALADVSTVALVAAFGAPLAYLIGGIGARVFSAGVGERVQVAVFALGGAVGGGAAALVYGAGLPIAAAAALGGAACGVAVLLTSAAAARLPRLRVVTWLAALLVLLVGTL
jgi:hypothetical protein